MLQSRRRLVEPVELFCQDGLVQRELQPGQLCWHLAGVDRLELAVKVVRKVEVGAAAREFPNAFDPEAAEPR